VAGVDDSLSCEGGRVLRCSKAERRARRKTIPRGKPSLITRKGLIDHRRGNHLADSVKKRVVVLREDGSASVDLKTRDSRRENGRAEGTPLSKE